MIVRRLGGWPASDWRDAFSEMARLQRQMDRLFEGLSTGQLRAPGAGVFPLMNVTEDKERYYVRAELPGTKAEDLDISIMGSSLSISGERKIPEEKEGTKYHRREREAGTFSRVISLPSDVNGAKVEARCNDGILTVVLPKAESAKPKQIAVKAS
jgi:HSP20 family protein